MRFLKHLFKYIKNIIKKEKHETKENNLEQLNKKAIIENYEYLYNQIEIGDIIWAKRYQNEAEKQLFPDGHSEGPFIVLKKENGKLISIKGTSVIPYEEYINMEFYLNNDGYNLDKATYFKLNKLCFINEYSFIKKMDKLKDIDQYKLFRHIKLSQKVYYTGENKTISFNFPIQVGDIINYNNQMFLVLDSDNKNITCVPVNNHLDYKNNVNLNFNSFINIDFSKTIYLETNNNNNINYISAVGNECIERILKIFQKHIYNRKNIKITQRGSVIFKDNKYYYIYGEEGQDWLVFEISKNRFENFEQIELNNVKYYTKFESSKINKKDSFSNIYLCLDEEKDKIKSIRKKYNELRKNMKISATSNYVNFCVGDIIQSMNYKNKRFIIIKKCKKTYECLFIDKIIDGIYDPILLRKTEVKLAKDKSITGIKWLEDHPEFELKSLSNPEIINEIFRTQIKFLKSKQNTIDILNRNQVNNISIDTIIKKDEKSDETFKVLQVIGEMLVCQSCSNLGLKHYFNRNNVIIVENMQKRK